ncbi:hypothetical protein OHB26_36345 [Nocardia sp. NBC_01503]|uniref:hypothetical protein n=1 Tax=Nocardia sp. NBC_01503 TaxID=2975997 RepID=UPI002E7B9B98|nr:hypothetical protein [Nocardia sp. NBC_01503]WTL32280.1 hypothetical protein OHB26_36345 [Nocardia sp. NBC_01503]
MSRREQRLRAEIPPFLKAYGRSSRRRNGMDPNDRHYDRAFEQKIKRLDPRDLDCLMNETGEGDDER